MKTGFSERYITCLVLASSPNLRCSCGEPTRAFVDQKKHSDNVPVSSVSVEIGVRTHTVRRRWGVGSRSGSRSTWNSVEIFNLRKRLAGRNKRGASGIRQSCSAWARAPQSYLNWTARVTHFAGTKISRLQHNGSRMTKGLYTAFPPTDPIPP